MAILGCLNNALVSTYNKEKESYWIGDRSLRNYKRNIPIPIPTKALLNMSALGGSRNYSFTLYNLPFRTYFGKDIDDKCDMWKRAIDGDYKRCDSSLLLEDNKIYLLTVFQFDKQVGNLNPEVIAEASLSIEIPIVVKINRYQYRIGTKEDFLYRRLAIQEAIRRCQKSSGFNRTKNGKARMRQKVNAFRDAEKRYINYKLHVYSKRLIDLCIKHQAATLLLVDQQETEELAKEEKFVMRNWNYGELRQKITYKAHKAGINIIVE